MCPQLQKNGIEGGGEGASRPRVGVPYRTVNEELSGKRDAYEKYLSAIRGAGGEPVEISLQLSREDLEKLCESIDGVVLTGGPADVEPNRYRAGRSALSAPADANRERTDLMLLAHSFTEHKPVLAICYGVQILNVFLGGSLIQDIESEVGSPIVHQWKNREGGTPEPHHPAQLHPDSRLARLSGAARVEINSSHHQSIREAGPGLLVAAVAPDGIIEGVEFLSKTDWVTGVQWHPERMEQDALSRALFGELVGVAREARVRG
jgi:putative glutamine amidotransferase